MVKEQTNKNFLSKGKMGVKRAVSEIIGIIIDLCIGVCCICAYASMHCTA